MSDIKQALGLLQDKQEQEYDMAAIDRSIEKHKKELQQLARDMRGLEGYSREVLLDDMKGLEESIKKLEQEKVQALSKATKLEKQRTEVDNFLQWAEGMRGRYHEATYDEKRTTLRVLGITVHAYKEIDEEHERYEIKVGLMQLYSDLTQNRLHGGEAGEAAR